MMKNLLALPLCAALILPLAGCGLIRSSYQSRVAQGQSLVEAGNYEQAIESLGSAITFSPRWPEAYMIRGDAYAALAQTQSEETMREANRQRALTDYQTAYSLNQSSLQVKERLIDFYISLGDETAQSAATKAKEETGTTEESAALYTLSRSYYEEALSFNRTNADAYSKIAGTLLAQEERKEAAEILEKGAVVSHDPALSARAQELRETLMREAEEQLRSAAAEILWKLPYYGDRSACRMSADQALAYARLIAAGIAGEYKGFSGYGAPLYDTPVFWDEPYAVMGYGAYETDRARVMLGDFAGDGNPYLYVCSSLVDSGSFEIYGWIDGQSALVVGEESYGGRQTGSLSETMEGAVVMEESETVGENARNGRTYRFSDGGASVSSDWDMLWDGETSTMYVRRNSVHTRYTEAEWSAYETQEAARVEQERADRNLSWPPLEDALQSACPLREMIEFLNAYANTLSGGTVEPVPVPLSHTEHHQMASAMLSKLFSLEHSALEQSANLCHTRLLDLNADGMEELLVAFENPYTTVGGDACRFVLYRWQNGKLAEYPGMETVDELYLVREKSSGEQGLLGVAESARYVYLFLSHTEETRTGQRRYFIVRDGQPVEIAESEYRIIHAKYETGEQILNYNKTPQGGAARNYENTIVALQRICQQE